MNELTMKANRLATIHKDLCAVAQAVTMGASDITTMGLTIKAASEKRHTPEMDKVAERLDRMTLNTTDMGFGLRVTVRTVLDCYSFQRDCCKRNKAQFVQQGSIVSELTEGGMFQELIALRKAAKAEAVADVVPVEVTEEATATPDTKQTLTEKATELAHSTIEGMTKRIVELHTALEHTAPGALNCFVISHESKLVTYQWVEGVWAPAKDIFNMPSYSSIEAARNDALDCVRSRGHRVTICQLGEVVHAVLMNSQMMIDQCSTFLSQQQEPVVSELWSAQQGEQA
ncbi:hypothetical protein [Aeromonas phage 32]|nr:hypothetical protein [Aeromonas phage 32]